MQSMCDAAVEFASLLMQISVPVLPGKGALEQEIGVEYLHNTQEEHSQDWAATVFHHAADCASLLTTILCFERERSHGTRAGS